MRGKYHVVVQKYQSRHRKKKFALMHFQDKTQTDKLSATKFTSQLARFSLSPQFFLLPTPCFWLCVLGFVLCLLRGMCRKDALSPRHAASYPITIPSFNLIPFLIISYISGFAPASQIQLLLRLSFHQLSLLGRFGYLQQQIKQLVGLTQPEVWFISRQFTITIHTFCI